MLQKASSSPLLWERIFFYNELKDNECLFRENKFPLFLPGGHAGRVSWAQYNIQVRVSGENQMKISKEMVIIKSNWLPTPAGIITVLEDLEYMASLREQLHFIKQFYKANAGYSAVVV